MSLNGLSSNGLITVPSNYSVRETLDRLEAALKAAGITIFARVDHAGGAAAVGLALRPTEVIIFGSPKGGTPLMQANQMPGSIYRCASSPGKTRPATVVSHTTT